MIKNTGFSLIFSLYFQEFTKKNGKKWPIFSRVGGSCDQNDKNFTFSKISDIFKYISKEFKAITFFCHILWFFKKIWIFCFSLCSNTFWQNHLSTPHFKSAPKNFPQNPRCVGFGILKYTYQSSRKY